MKKYTTLLLLIITYSLSQAATLNIPLSEIPIFNPYQGNELSMNKVINQVAEGLVRINHHIRPVPALAERFHIDLPSKSITFYLKDKKFHDGSKVTSRDILRCIDGARKAETDLTSQMAKIVAVSDRELRIVLNSTRFIFFLKKLAGIEGVIFKKGKNGKFLGTGPYRIDSMTKQEVLLKKVNSTVHYDYIHFIKTNDPLELFKKGKIDVISNINLNIKNGDLKKGTPYQDQSAVTYALVLNLRQGVFIDREVRQAFSLAIDRERFMASYKKRGTVATGVIPVGHLGYRERPYQLDLPAAKKIIARKLPIDKRKVTFGFVDRGGIYNELIQYFTHVFSELGIELEIKKVSGFTNMLKNFRHNHYDLIIKGDGPRFYESSTVFTSYISGQRGNISSFSNQKLDQLYYAYEASSNDSQRVEILEKMENILREEVPVIPMMYPIFRTWWRNSVAPRDNKKFSIQFWEFPYHQYGETQLLTTSR